MMPHLIKNPGMRKAIGLPIEKKKKAMPFPRIFTSLSFTAKELKDAFGVDSIMLNNMIAVISRINVNILIGLKNTIMPMETFSPYIKPTDHPYFVVVKALVISLMLGRSMSKKEVEAVLKKLTSVMRPHLTNMTRMQSPYEITVSMANTAYNELRACRSRTTKPSSALGSNVEQAQTVKDISDMFRILIREIRLVSGMLNMY